jgi:hypothetical protein
MIHPEQDRAAAEIAYWNGTGGERWLNTQDTHERARDETARVGAKPGYQS